MSQFEVTVRVIAGAKVESFEELAPQSFKIKVRAVPERGKANERVSEILAEYLDVSKSQIVLKSGAMSKDKVFIISE